MALAGERDRANAELVKLAGANALNGWSFNEWLHGRTLAPRGMLVLFGQSSGPVPPFDPQVLNQKGSLCFTRPSLVHYIATRDELLARDKVSLDLTWLRDESLEDADNLPPPEVIAQEIVEDLEAALAEFAQIAASLGERSAPG